MTDPGLNAVDDETVGFSGLLRFRQRHRLPIVRQIESSECGLACLAMILAYHGQHHTLGELRLRFLTSAKGSTLGDLVRCADALGLVGRPVRFEMHEIGELQLPCVVHWNLDHFVVLHKVAGNSIHIHDPARGARKVSMEEAGEAITGVALELGKGPEFKRKAPPPALSLRALAGSVRGIGASVRNIFAFAIALEVIALLTPQFTQIVVDEVLADTDRDLLTFLGLSFTALVLIQTALTAFRTWCVVWLSTHFTMNWTGNVFQHLMRLPQLFFLRRHLGDIVSRFSAINAIQQSLTTQMVSAIVDGVMALATLVLLMVYSGMLAALIVSGTTIYVLLRLAYYRAFQEANLSQIVVNAKQQSSLMESVRGSQTLRLNNQGPLRAARYLNLTAEALNTQVEVQRLGMIFTMMSGAASGLQRVGILWLGAWLALKGELTAGMLMAFAAYSDQFVSRSTAFADYVIQLRLLRLQGERLADIVLSAPEPNLIGTYQGPLPAGSIRFENVFFRYADSEPWVVRNCSFEIQANESVALVGASGCGKSTLLRLMLGLIEPQMGKIYVGGVELDKLGKAAYRTMVGAVLQDDKLFAGSLADNISFFDDEAMPEAIEAAAVAADIHTDICAMPMGYHTMVGDMGSALSGGQQQRLHLARALYRRPKILALDEATSHLDIPREQRIVSLLKRMSITRVLIAHRPETVASADRVLLMTQGGVHELSQVPSGAGQVA